MIYYLLIEVVDEIIDKYIISVFIFTSSPPNGINNTEQIQKR